MGLPKYVRVYFGSDGSGMFKVDKERSQELKKSYHLVCFGLVGKRLVRKNVKGMFYSKLPYQFRR